MESHHVKDTEAFVTRQFISAKFTDEGESFISYVTYPFLEETVSSK